MKKVNLHKKNIWNGLKNNKMNYLDFILKEYDMTEYDEFELLKRRGAKLLTDNYKFIV